MLRMTGHRRVLTGLAATLLAVCAVALVAASLLSHGRPRSAAASHAGEPAGLAHDLGAASGARTGVAGGLSALPVAARLAVSRGLGGDLRRFALARASGGYVARNAVNGFSTRFDAGGAALRTVHGAQLGLTLRGIGFGRALAPVADYVAPRVRANRVEYRRGAASEWFANGPAGLEQGFTIPRAPGGHAVGGPLTLALALSGSLRAHLDGAGGLTFATTGGHRALSYGALSVSDARGRALPAHLALAGGRLRIRIDARGARYPLRVDPLLAAAELYASGGKETEDLGLSVAVSGGTVVAGTQVASVGGQPEAGDAYVFVEGAGGWATGTQATELLPAVAKAGERFGHAVAISGKTIVVGAPNAEGIGIDNGAAYVYSEPAGGWAASAERHPTTELVDSEDQVTAEFGKSVAVAGETVVVGTPRYVNYTYKRTTFKEHPETGGAFVFVQPAGGWAAGGAQRTQSFTLMETEKEYEEYEEDDYFGTSVALYESGESQTVVVAAPAARFDGNFKQGVALVFARPAGGWTSPSLLEENPAATLSVSGGVENEKLGEASGKGSFGVERQPLAISAGEVVIGAPEAKVGANQYEGVAYVFAEPPGGWASQRVQTQAAKLEPSDGKANWVFGATVAADDGTLMVSGGGNGYVYSEPRGGWSGELHESSELLQAASAVSLTAGYALVGDGGLAPPEGKGKTDQGGVLAVPLGPIVQTAGTSGVGELAATVEGSVAPNRNAVSECVFLYGTTTAYGSEAPCTPTVSGTGSTATTVSAELSGLAPGTTYHYRVLATNVDGTSQGADETFTTAAGPSGHGTGGPEEPPGGKTTSPPATTTTTTTTGSTTAGSPVAGSGAAQTGAALEATRALACSTAQIALIDVVAQGSHVLLTGAARQVLAGKKVAIELLSTGKVVATPTVTPAGTFAASVPLPPAKGRGSNRTRYQASIGSLRSLALKLERRAYMLHTTLTGSHVSIAGRVTGSFRAGTAVHITLRVTCAKYKSVATVKLTSAGTFSATVPAPSGADSQIAVYRATTTVLQDGHPFATFTLPTPPS
jgi:trimeric autotransporter adhesin